MLVTESGMVMLFKEIHPLKELFLMQVTLSGISSVTNELQSLKALSPITVTGARKVAGARKVMLSNELHLAKAPLPMVVTESGMVILVNDSHPSKVSWPMAVNESGMVMLANELHHWKA